MTQSNASFAKAPTVKSVKRKRLKVGDAGKLGGATLHVMEKMYKGSKNNSSSGDIPVAAATHSPPEEILSTSSVENFAMTTTDSGDGRQSGRKTSSSSSTSSGGSCTNLTLQCETFSQTAMADATLPCTHRTAMKKDEAQASLGGGAPATMTTHEAVSLSHEDKQQSLPSYFSATEDDVSTITT